MAFDKEADLARALIGHLQNEGWDVYEEIAPLGGGAKRADIVATKDGKTRIIECKLTLGFPVLYQGQNWVGYADEIFVATPAVGWDWKQKKVTSLAVRCALEVIHIGVIEVLAESYKRPPGLRYHLPESWPPVIPKKKRSIDSMLKPEVQAFNANAAGSAGGSFWTPYKSTCKQLLDLVKLHPEGLSVQEAVSRVSHHYANERSARGRISHLAKDKAIPGLTIETRGRTPYLILSGDLNAKSEPQTDA